MTGWSKQKTPFVGVFFEREGSVDRGYILTSE
jgi:hypothetical protein